MNPSTKESIDKYALHKIPTGGFLRSVLENNLMESFMRADNQNREDMFEICNYIYNFLPADCHGSPERVDLWIKKGRE